MKDYILIDNILFPPGPRHFSYSDGDAVETRLLQQIREAPDVSIGSADLAAAIRDWPSMYHLSPARTHLLRPLSGLLQGKNSAKTGAPAPSVLEIGCGCGALTRYLGELGSIVTALEGSERRARITRERCRDLDNVRVVCDNFDHFNGEEQFDIVLLIGVLEYSHLFIKGQYPPLDMLRRARSCLRPDGQLIVAIENKLGLKYWAGAPEDHTGRPYDGIEDRYTSNTAVTFGRQELILLLSNAGFASSEFLYPFPDYKLPDVIVKEAAFFAEDLQLSGLLHEKFDYPHGNGQATEFWPTRTATALLNNHLMPDLSNSFLVIAGPERQPAAKGQSSDNRPSSNNYLSSNPSPSSKPTLAPDEALVYSYNSARQKCYCKSNIFTRGDTGAIQVLRQRLYPDAPCPTGQPMEHLIIDEAYIPGKLLSAGAFDIITREGWTVDGLHDWAARYYQVLLDHSHPGGDATIGTGHPILPGQYLDLTPFNILITGEGKATVFDQEWRTPENVPLYFIFFRGLVYSLDKMSMYALPADGTPTGLIPLVTALVNTFFPFGDEELASCVRLEEKYFGAVPLLPGRPFSHGGIRLKKTWRTQYQQASRELQDTREQYQAEVTALHARLDNALREQAAQQIKTQEQLARLQQDHQAHIGLLHQHLDWYKRTYEQRSLPGVILQRQLTAARDREKYLTAFLLSTMQEKGVTGAVSLIGKTLLSKGLQGLLHPRQTLLPLMRMPAISPPGAGAAIGEVEDPVKAMKEIAGFTRRPKISFIMPVFNTDPRWLQRAVDSIRDQWYDNWELCIADDGSTDRGTQQVLHRIEKEDKIRLIRLAKNAGISEASNAALEVAGGEYIALMDHDDELTPDALYQVVKDLHLHGDADILYTDECKVDENGRLSDPFYKPAYSPELLLNMMYPGHLTVYHKNFLLEKAGRFRKEYDLSQDYDLMLRAVEKTSRIRHIEKVVYHWRMTAGSSSQGGKPHARITNIAALADAMKRREIAAGVVALPTANRAVLHVEAQPLVSIIIPTDSKDNLRDTLDSLYRLTDYPNFEIIVVTHSRLAREAASYKLQATSQGPDKTDSSQPKRSPLVACSLKLAAVPYDHPYNFSDKCNAGAAHARGEILLFFNDDVRPLEKNWLGNTIEYLFVPGVGGVSPKLIYEDDTIQYAGMATGVRGLTGTTFHGYRKDSTDYINFPQSVRNVSILSGACLAIRKQLFDDIGGFDPVNTPSAHSDVDLSFKILDAGFRCVYTPYATLRHIGHLSLKEYETSPAGRRKDKADIYLLRRWAQRVAEDPYFTASMRNHLYHDSPEPYRIYAPSAGREAASFKLQAASEGPGKTSQPTAVGSPPKRSPLVACSLQLVAQKDILLVSHDLSLSGAPIMLLQLCRLLIRHGYFVTVICEREGPAGALFLEAGAPVIIDSLLLRQHETLTRFARNFDHVICNTVVTWPVVRQLSDLTHTLWWLHEAKVLETFSHDAQFINTLANAPTVIVPSDYALQYAKKYNAHPERIYYGYPDLPPDAHHAAAGEKIIFSIIGSIEPRKGQDILVKAFQQLDPLWQDKVELWLVGRPHDAGYYQQLLQDIGPAATHIKVTGERDHEQCLDLMRRSDVIVCPSRDDPFPVVIVEALCLGKPCIVSTHTGFAELMTDSINGFVIPNDDSRTLAMKIQQALRQPALLAAMGKAARLLYQEHLTMEVFEERFLTLLDPAPASERPSQTEKTLLCQD
ncbi:glycosyltransferase [Flavitalea sp. BT771]|uniref:glycosyltransferase n=1 Tax=Flavitalea sp. BT771 TaxID=3063329 RepID=UPI0026E45C9C|nr:glycosyltransferase [Flavitalea sp. BT771]MDO6432590.1 glycosyltransferase [Flavitalea sp. BT771]MDV6222134.1 glycosyltransferase [Flavitalea sp. BT771]